MNLQDRLKKKGLDIAEEAAAEIVKELFVMAKEEVEKMDTAYKPLLLLALPEAEKLAMGLVDKIDGEDDEGR